MLESADSVKVSISNISYDKIHFIANDRYKKCQEKQRGAVVIS